MNHRHPETALSQLLFDLNQSQLVLGIWICLHVESTFLIQKKPELLPHQSVFSFR